ncbi:MAG: DUF2889 domain-containing protein [Alphaproteobacteria bacterium]
MPLSPAKPRRHIHTRRIECRGYLREDDLWDVEAWIEDTKAYAFDSELRGAVEAGGQIHDMVARLTVDDRLTIHAAEAESRVTPYRICPAAAAGFSRLAGLRIRPGWMREAAKAYGGREACTHLFELLRPMATTAFQTIFPWREGEAAARGAAPDQSAGPPVDSCYAYAADREVVLRMKAAGGG